MKYRPLLPQATIRRLCKEMFERYAPRPDINSVRYSAFEKLIDEGYIEEVDENEYMLTVKGRAACFDSEYIIKQAKEIFAEWGIPVDDYEWEHVVDDVTHTVFGVYNKNGNRVTLTDVYVRKENSEILQSIPVLG